MSYTELRHLMFQFTAEVRSGKFPGRLVKTRHIELVFQLNTLEIRGHEQRQP
jgi:hypothetical protein